MESRKKKAGLILSSIGVFYHFLLGSIFLFLLLPTPVIQSITVLLTGTLSLIGIIIGVKEIKIGGAIILISIPISNGYLLILNNFLEFVPPNTPFEILLLAFIPIFNPFSCFLVIGGILCLMGFDE